MIRKAEKKDLPALERIYRAAKAFMVASGNPTQWEEGYPGCLLEGDIRRGELYVLCEEGGEPHAAFLLALGEDPTYQVIEGGSWTSSAPYGTIHRLGSDGVMRGVFSQCLVFCRRQIPHLRADTHRDNTVMQHLLEKYGFTYRGIIHIYDGSPRLAYELLP
ncbi:MAG: N-acetyltransferase [Oscillospiraceae bacterium]|nr:N-acetyltransferase [Oscillospiraceae bacterium]